MIPRHFLFLQGLRSPFFLRLANALLNQNLRVSKINFTVGDYFYWSGQAHSCQASLEELDQYYEKILQQLSPTDIVLFGDCRPVHLPAIKRASRLGIRVHVFEEGYFRPDWITLEEDGVNGYSRLPKQSDWYLRVAPMIVDLQPVSLPSGLNARVIHDVAYNAACMANPFIYPRYPSHVTYNIHDEYLAYIRRVLRVRRTRNQDTATVQALTESSHYFILALQVRGDAQLRFHSQYADTEKMIREVIRSFAVNAPVDTQLVIKNHPLDPGFVNYKLSISAITRELDIAHRVIFLETGHLPTLLDHSRGLVTVNSTSIGQALFHGCPVKALGNSIFNLEGLCFQGSLKEFWNAPNQVDQVLFNAFKKVVTYITQINGGLYSKKGIALAVENAVPRLLERRSRLAALNDVVLNGISE